MRALATLAADLLAVRRKVEGIRGPGVIHGRNGISIRPIAGAANPLPPMRSIESTFPVLVVWSAGSDGTSTTYATWTYNLYRLSDTTYTTALTDAAVQPTCGRCRSIKASVTKATDGSVGLAYIDADGEVALMDCQEKYDQENCT